MKVAIQHYQRRDLWWTGLKWDVWQHRKIYDDDGQVPGILEYGPSGMRALLRLDACSGKYLAIDCGYVITKARIFEIEEEKNVDEDRPLIPRTLES